MKKFFLKYKHAWVLLYTLFYMPCFAYLEAHVTTKFHIIHVPVDDYIPFVEYFIIPYLLWFVYIAVTVGYFFFTDVKAYYKLTAFLFTGMTLFLIISALYPNGLDLRPNIFPRDNIFTDMVKQLYRIDTPTNVLPSLHVFNSIGVYIAISRDKRLASIKWVRYGALILSTLIILSTMFLKQHSIIDVITGCLMASVLYQVIYAGAFKKSESFSKQTVS